MEGLLYAYGAPNVVSEQQRKYIRERVNQQLAEAKRKNSASDTNTSSEFQSLERTDTNFSSASGYNHSNGLTRMVTESSSGSYYGAHNSHHSGVAKHGRDASADMDSRANMIGSVSTTRFSSSGEKVDLLANPFELRHGRRYLRDTSYPLPCDLAEIQRQNLRTLLGCSVFGRAVCCPKVPKNVPQKVLEVGCGGAYWTARCHEYFTSLGHRRVAFTGTDIAPLAPDLKKQGINWTFVQHDMRRFPWPFDDEEFDLIMFKDLSMIITNGAAQNTMDECIRMLKVGGTLEIWESDSVLRSLLPHPPPPTAKQRQDHEIALQTGTFLISPSTPFAPAQNKYLTQANIWIVEALDNLKLTAMPCARLAQMLYQEPETLGDVSMRRVAIPLGELRWERERESYQHGRSKSDVDDLKGKGRARVADQGLTNEQVALRHTALLTMVQLIESLEPLLKESSGKNTEEWSHWWASMMADIMDPSRGAVNGECLEVGAWWATKLA